VQVDGWLLAGLGDDSDSLLAAGQSGVAARKLISFAMKSSLASRCGHCPARSMTNASDPSASAVRS